MRRGLTDVEVREIRLFFDDHQAAIAAGRPPSLTIAEIGRLFGVSRWTVYCVGQGLSHSDDDGETGIVSRTMRTEAV